MATTITQARPLLTAAELELFDQSRTEPIKALTLSRLRGKVTRARTLRDKYRDLYRRQTVAVRSAPNSKGRSPVGSDNERTQRKADILQEVLERYEARATLVGERGDSKSSSKTGAKAIAKGAAKGSAAAKAGADPSSMKEGSSAAASKKTAKGAAAAPVAKAGKTAKAADADKAAPQPKSAKPAASGKKSSVSAQLNTLGGAGAGMSQGTNTDTDAAPKRTKAGTAPARSSKAPSRKAPTANNKASAPDVNAPLDTLPSSKRKSPLKTDPTNTAIQAHQSSQGRRAQGKRDSR